MWEKYLNELMAPFGDQGYRVRTVDMTLLYLSAPLSVEVLGGLSVLYSSTEPLRHSVPSHSGPMFLTSSL